MDNQPNQPRPSRPPTSAVMWVVLGIVLIIAALGLYGLSRVGNSNANSYENGNVLSNSTGSNNLGVLTNAERPGWKKYSYVDQGFVLEVPDSARIGGRLGETKVVDGRSYPDFTLVITDPSVTGELVISNRETGFEADTVISEERTALDGKPVRQIISERSVNGQVARIKRYLFFPLNNGTIYEVYWLSYPVDSVEQQEFFGKILQSIALLQ